MKRDEMDFCRRFIFCIKIQNCCLSKYQTSVNNCRVSIDSTRIVIRAHVSFIVHRVIIYFLENVFFVFAVNIASLPLASTPTTSHGRGLWKTFLAFLLLRIFLHLMSDKTREYERIYNIDFREISLSMPFHSLAGFTFIIYAHTKKNYEFDWKCFNLLPSLPLWPRHIVYVLTLFLINDKSTYIFNF